LLTIQVQRLQKVICSISSYLHHYLYMDYWCRKTYHTDLTDDDLVTRLASSSALFY
jgi:hypothetical protein